MPMHQFNVGQAVAFIPGMFHRYAAPGDYQVIAVMPDRDGDHMYRIKNPLEVYERAVEESVLVKSDGYIPDHSLSKRDTRRSFITLPKLLQG
jgi:hypothetical protein